MRNSWTLIIMLFLLGACDKASAPDCFKKTGAEVTELRELQAFKELVLYSYMDLELVQDSVFKIELIGGKNLLPKVETRVTNNTLEIENNNNCGFVRGYKQHIKLKLYAPKVRVIRNKGVGDIRVPDNFNQDSMEVFTDAVGDIYVNGTYKELVLSSGAHGDLYTNASCEKCVIYVNATNYVHAEGLNSKNVNVIHNGLGDCYLGLAPTNLFEYQINSSGNIYYSGDPQQILNNSGTVADGKLIKK